jgi:hypothetical protein
MMKILNKLVALAALCLPLAVAAVAQCPLARKPVTSMDEALELAKRAATAYELSTIPVACLDFQPKTPTANPDYEIVIREHHSQECGGDLQTGPRVANLHISLNGKITTDLYSMDTGTYKPLVCKRSKKHPTKH